MNRAPRKTIILLFLTACIFSSCVSTKKMTEQALYFRNISDSLLQKTPVEVESTIQKGDILSVSVITPNERSARMFNQPFTYGGPESTGETSSSVGNTPGQGYLVNEKGTITFPYLGNVTAAGLTRTVLADSIAGRLRKYVDSAIVSIRLLNYRITVLGEVVKPGTISIPGEKISILDAIGLAGDLTVYGKRNNIRIIRSVDGIRQTATLDINKGDIFDSPFFYLKQNDIVYIEPNARKIPNTDQASLRNVSIGLGIISAIGVIISTINVLKN